MTLPYHIFIGISVDPDIQAIAKACNVSVYDITKGKSRKTDVVIARQAIVYIFKTYRGLTHHKIAKKLNMDQSSVGYSYRQFCNDLQFNRSRICHLTTILNQYKNSNANE